MRTAVLVFALVLISGRGCSGMGAVPAQDGFKVDFPGQPKVTETTWKSEYNYMLPAHV